MQILLVGVEKNYEKKLQCILSHIKCDLVSYCPSSNSVALKSYNPDIIILGSKESFFESSFPDWDNKIITFIDDMERKTEADLVKSIFRRFSGVEVLRNFSLNINLSDDALLDGQFVIARENIEGNFILFFIDLSEQSISPVHSFLPIFSVFHSYINSGSSLSSFIPKINQKLFEILPGGTFCRVFCCEINPTKKTILSWSGGMEEVYLLKNNGLAQKLVKNINMPLGLMNNNFETELELLRFCDKDSLYIFTNNIYRLKRNKDDIFFVDHVPKLLEENISKTNVFNTLVKESQYYLNDDLKESSLTFAAIEIKAHQKEKQSFSPSKDATSQEWQFLLELNPNTLLNFDPLTLLMNVVACFPELYTQKSHIYSILSELYCNALDHGLLQLAPGLKTTHEGFIEYYLQRQHALKKLEEGFIRIAMRHEKLEDGGCLYIFIEDSGKGFDYASDFNDASQNYMLAGRGIGIVRSLCKSIEYLDKGNKVLAVYQW